LITVLINDRVLKNTIIYFIITVIVLVRLSESFASNCKVGTTPSSHHKTKLFKSPPVTSGAGKCEELDEAAYTDETRRDVSET
jgi:hypothetical protein